jgi:hypothetical protein
VIWEFRTPAAAKYEHFIHFPAGEVADEIID